MSILLCILIINALCVCLLIIRAILCNKRHGIKYTLTDTSITSEWDFDSPITQLRLLKLFIDNELAGETRNKYIREYTRLKKSLKEDGYDVSDFPDYEIK